VLEDWLNKAPDNQNECYKAHCGRESEDTKKIEPDRLIVSSSTLLTQTPLISTIMIAGSTRPHSYEHSFGKMNLASQDFFAKCETPS